MNAAGDGIESGAWPQSARTAHCSEREGFAIRTHAGTAARSLARFARRTCCCCASCCLRLRVETIFGGVEPTRTFTNCSIKYFPGGNEPALTLSHSRCTFQKTVISYSGLFSLGLSFSCAEDIVRDCVLAQFFNYCFKT
ncbi:hypothetical protein M758_2G175300 [Ceratodon purpureus]|nr:hypothetical protein M758_2G175300 [Ceratodon purpureus]